MRNYLLAIGLSLSSMAAFAEAEQTAIYTESKPVIMLTNNQTEFAIQLKSNPTTGYSWFLRDYSSDLFTPVKHLYQPEKNKKLIGAGGYEIWTFSVKPAAYLVPQQTYIRFVYSRPWENDNQSEQMVFKISTK